MKNPRVLRLPANMLGRDWVIGDVHGAFDLVEQALFAVRFRPDVDRLICVGDLVDRGNDSARVEQFLQQPYVHAVRGNHDHLVATTDPLVLQAMAISNHNGLRWIGDLSIPRVRRIQQALAELPYAIEIASADGTLPTGIVHAQVPQNWPWPDMVDALSDWPEEDALFDDVMKSRYKFDSQDAAAVHGVSRVFVGHCICWNGPRILGNTVFTDTGAVFTGQEEGASLSIIDLSASNAQIEAARMDDEHPGLRICRANSAFEFEFEFTDAPARDRRTAQRP